MEHERMRFETMSTKQLKTRLGRIKDREKLRRFIYMAKEYEEQYRNANFFQWRAGEYRRLAEEATRKLEGARMPVRHNTDAPAEHRELVDYLNRLGMRR